MAETFEIDGTRVGPGERATIRLAVARRTTHADVFVPIHVVRGRRDGPRLFVCGALHGDEITGVEIIRRLLRRPSLQRLRGTLIAVPVVNVYGFVSQSRYLPDRRDLNRVFPGSPSGSLGARLAHRIMTEVVGSATHAIDLHSGAIHRGNLPQIRASLDQPGTAELARAFGAPVVLDANVRDGSLRQAVLERSIPMLLYEGGEALRFDEVAIRAGLRGTLNVMRALDMLPRSSGPPGPEPFIARSSRWIRAPESGILIHPARLGAAVTRGQRLGVVSDPLGDTEVSVESSLTGIVIGKTTIPLVYEGDALFHVASLDPGSAAQQLESFREGLLSLEESDLPPERG